LRIGGRWLLSDIGASTVLMSSSEDGKTWVQRTWKLDDEGWSSLTVVGRAPMLHFTGSGNPAALFPVPAVLPDDPPDSIAIDASRIDDPCEPEEGSSARFLNRLEPHDRDLEAQMDRGASPDARGAAVSLSARQRVTQLTKKGAECTAGYAFESRGAGAPDTTALIYRDGPGWAGWWFSNRKDHAASVSAQRVACVTPPAPAHR
jgi:hypothetical protein